MRFFQTFLNVCQNSFFLLREALKKIKRLQSRRQTLTATLLECQLRKIPSSARENHYRMSYPTLVFLQRNITIKRK